MLWIPWDTLLIILRLAPLGNDETTLGSAGISLPLPIPYGRELAALQQRTMPTGMLARRGQKDIMQQEQMARL